MKSPVMAVSSSSSFTVTFMLMFMLFGTSITERTMMAFVSVKSIRAIVSLSIVAIAILCHWQRQYRSMPPGPVRWPLVGSLLSVGFQQRHRTYARLANKYGPVMHFCIENANVIVVGSPEVALEVLKTKDAEWASRPPTLSGKYIGVDFHALDFAPNGPHWRHLRKICATHIFSPARLRAQSYIRREEVLRIVDGIFSQSQRGLGLGLGEAIDLRSVSYSLMDNIISRVLFGNKYSQSDHPIAKVMHSFRDDVQEAIILAGAFAISDGGIIPALSWIDLRGYHGRIKRVSQRLERVYRMIIEDHKRDLELGEYEEEKQDFVHVLLSLQGEDRLSDKSLMGLIMDVLPFGKDVVAAVLEFAMAELIQNQSVLRKLQGEIDRVVGDDRLVDESDICKIPYLECVVKEALRLHPPAPLTDPHYNEEAVDLAGYKIPPKCIMFINIWALANDPKWWDEPSEFRPERFEAAIGGNNDFRYLPFSAGRRKCPAGNLAYVTMEHAIAVLVQAFDWSLPEGQLNINMEDEEFGASSAKKYPLLALAKPRLHFLPPSQS
uniref:Cytochrome P450 n=1 Tax=Picea sitchensis TaxID=3332 RepID=C0PQ07_PICSI|nr:unknown [Picea sitchensis]